jgi:predicted nuclease with TOPRIM domain
MNDWQDYANNLNYLLKNQKDESMISYDLLQDHMKAAVRDRDAYEKLWRAHKECYEIKSEECADLEGLFKKLKEENNNLKQENSKLQQEWNDMNNNRIKLMEKCLELKEDNSNLFTTKDLCTYIGSLLLLIYLVFGDYVFGDYVLSGSK